MLLARKMGRHPFNTVYGGYGEHLLLIWYEHGEGHNSIITRSLPSMEHIWRKQFAEEPEAELREFWRINIVMPPGLYKLIDQEAYTQNMARSVLARTILRKVLTDKDLRERVLTGGTS